VVCRFDRAMEDSINIAYVLLNSRANGPGNRDVIWVQGCTIGCKGCRNLAFQANIKRHIIPVGALLKYLSGRVGIIDGITISGGEPTEQAPGVAGLLRGAHAFGLSTVVYTGRYHAELSRSKSRQIHSLLRVTDLLIDGPFIQELHDPILRWRGSSNQNVICLSDRFRLNELEKPNSPAAEIIVRMRGDSLEEIRTGIPSEFPPFE
jgi:anaerobic ribonucleoside-triphosphate reductase activating protein